MMECKNDHLLKCYDIYQNKDLKILVMEYCSGKTLEAHLQKKKKIPEREAVEILRQVISGIAVTSL
jgi:serine/threonine protein kinase